MSHQCEKAQSFDLQGFESFFNLGIFFVVFWLNAIKAKGELQIGIKRNEG